MDVMPLCNQIISSCVSEVWTAGGSPQNLMLFFKSEPYLLVGSAAVPIGFLSFVNCLCRRDPKVDAAPTELVTCAGLHSDCPPYQRTDCPGEHVFSTGLCQEGTEKRTPVCSSSSLQVSPVNLTLNRVKSGVTLPFR